MVYLARFEEIDGELFRFDTRIYLNGYDATKPSKFIGAIVGKNPGSATPAELGKFVPLELKNDKMLPTVRNRFLDAHKLARKQIPENSFVRVWNLFYLCDPDLESACNKARKFQELPTCRSENEEAPIVWYGWGCCDERLNQFKERFLSRSHPQQFFYDHDRSRVNNQKPTIKSFAKHTQGMPSKPVNEYLANII